MDTTTPKRTWRKVDLAVIAGDWSVRAQLLRLWLGQNYTPFFACLFAVPITMIGYVLLWSPELPSTLVAAPLISLLLGFVILIFAFIVRQRRPHGAATAIEPDPGPLRSIVAVGAVELLLIVLAFFSGEPLGRSVPLLATVLCVNALLAAWIRAATKQLRARMLADPELPRILAENAATVGSMVYAHSKAPEVSAWTETQRASPHQDIAVARHAWLMKLLWGVPAAIGFILLSLPRAAPQLHVDRLFSGDQLAKAVVILLVLGAVGAWMHNRADRRRRALAAEVKVQAAPSAQYALQKDHRTPILLLRSFVDDAARNGTDRFEESIAPWLSRYGPLVAIGDPKDILPDLGAYRDYVADEHWQERARAYIKSAAVIVMIPGKTRWIQRELLQILDGDYLHKTAFVFPPGLSPAEKQARLVATWEAFAKRSELQPLQIADLAETVVLHFFAANAVTRVTDAAFVGTSEYNYDKALFAAFRDR